MRRMNKDEAKAELTALANLNEFSRKSRIPRRTLTRIVLDEGPIRESTLTLVASALKRLKPAKKESA